ncbi:MAG: 30S ribosomal protein S12 methylthiotransferase RimO [Clostridiales bacterium]|nr:30S ribosomal protein S12 methylthiotransferase RimO [Clostridiales bacterium]
MTKEELKTKVISAISLGCDKNKVDLEHMLGRLQAYGFQITDDVYNCDIVIVNTCAFIQPAQEEAIANIIEMEDLKKQGRIEKIIVTGCFPERNYSSMKENFPNIDAFLKLRDNENICEKIASLYEVEISKGAKKYSRVLTSAGGYAYLKIADGCNNVCSYCTIPRIRGRYKSEPIEKLVDEAKGLVSNGINEIILVAQDTTRYGEDLYGENKLIALCEQLSKIKDLKWIRIHYAYPEKVSDELLSYIVKNDKICKYLDMPLQHIDDKILSSMRRRLNEDETRKLIYKIKNNYPEIAIRSTFIVGYPGETRDAFKKLCDFIQESKFDYAGFFPYSKEPNTASFYMKGHLSNWIKKRRHKKITKLQNAIVSEKVMSQIGQEMIVKVDYFDDNNGEYVCHSEKLSPLVDFGVRIVDNNSVKVNDFVKVKIYDFDGNDYKGEII